MYWIIWIIVWAIVWYYIHKFTKEIAEAMMQPYYRDLERQEKALKKLKKDFELLKRNK